MTNPPEPRIWLWQNIVSPHMASLAVALARRGCDVVYAAVESMSPDRIEQGWSPPPLDGVRLELVPTGESVERLVESVPPGSVHICSGIRANGLIGVAQRALARRGLQQWIVMETVDDAGWRGALKRLEYRRLFRCRRNTVQGVLAIGHSTPAWVGARGMPASRVFPFAYFLPNPDISAHPPAHPHERFRVLFAGQFIALKRLDHLVEALARLSPLAFELAVVGSGPLEHRWKTLAESALPGRVDWIGRLPLESVPAEMARADCLVLPSRHDGWGAVVSEALMVGTPVICSDACGSADVVRASGRGGVFPSGDRESLTQLLGKAIAGGCWRPDSRMSLAAWAECLGGDAGAAYLISILQHASGGAARPAPPWEFPTHARDGDADS
jgi:glycosyltransferase involved in cell wall biosynthesis